MRLSSKLPDTDTLSFLIYMAYDVRKTGNATAYSQVKDNANRLLNASSSFLQFQPETYDVPASFYTAARKLEGIAESLLQVIDLNLRSYPHRGVVDTLFNQYAAARRELASREGK